MMVPLALTALWLMFATAMGLKNAKTDGRLTEPAENGGRRLLTFGIVFDVLCNCLFLQPLFRERPRRGEWTVTQRVQRLVKGPPGWRKDRAVWFAIHAMNVHCPADDPHIEL